MSNRQRQSLMLLAALFAFNADMLSKGWANSALEPGVRHAFVPSLLNLVLVNNTGLAFSMVNDNGLLAKILASTVFIGLLYFYWQRYLAKPIPSPPVHPTSNPITNLDITTAAPHVATNPPATSPIPYAATNPTTSLASTHTPHPTLEQLGMSIVIGAAAGNLFERLLYGHVTDFLEFAFISFPVFNLADVLIDTGIGLVLLSMFLEKKLRKAQGF